MSRVKRDVFKEERRKSYIKKGDSIEKNKTKIFDDDCTICMDTFNHGTGILITPCRHCFHNACLENWINTQVEAALKLEAKKIQEGQAADLS